MEIFEVECLVIGAGVVGLSVARELAMKGHEVLLVDQEPGIGMQTSSRNSEVIHAGIYYPEGSLKARLCVEGKRRLYDYCESNLIPFERCGKLIVAANSEQEAQLKNILQHAKQNCVDDLLWLQPDEVKEREPGLQVGSALYSPSTGIIDSHAYMLQLQADFERHGGQCVFNTRLTLENMSCQNFEFYSQSDATLIRAKQCVNSAGLSAIDLMKGADNASKLDLPRSYFAKGSYFRYAGSVPFSHLIYPVPEQGGLGVHLTLDLAGMAKFGPDVEWLDELDLQSIDYQVDSFKRHKFMEAIQTYWPDIEINKLVADYSGIRPKVTGASEPSGDFIIQCSAQHGVAGLVNLFGIESPGLTSSLAIASYVSNLLNA